MQMDDSPNKVYIYDLDEELSDVEPQEEKIIFLPDIERELTKIPKKLLTNQSPPPTTNEMVLYTLPSSLTVPEEQDSVRRVIMEARARARQQQASEESRLDGVDAKSLQNGDVGDDALGVEASALDTEDVDAMDTE